MGWSTSMFWAATPRELYHSYRGYLKSRGIDPDEKDPSLEQSDALTAQLNAAWEARLKGKS